MTDAGQAPTPVLLTPEQKDAAVGLAQLIRREAPDLYQGVTELTKILKSCVLKSMGNEAPSTVGENAGERPHPFDFLAATRFKVHNVHHSACIRAKTRALVGLGHVLESDTKPEPAPDPMNPQPAPKKRREKSKVAKALDPLCRHSWGHTLLQLAEDYWQTGNAFLEVVRGAGNKVTGLHWQPASDCRIVVRDSFGTNYDFLIRGRVGGDVRMLPFGTPERAGSGLVIGVLPPSSDAPKKMSEMIHIPEPTTLDRWYGVPQWLASTALVELVQALHQHQFDWHVNRGVPEFLLLLLGAKVDSKTWKNLKEVFDSHVGLGNQHKGSLFNLPQPDLEVRVEKLAMEGVANGTFFRDMSEALSSVIVSAHGVPPSLAGILIPGKMGAANEAANSLMVFQTLEIGTEQEHFANMLGSRLGTPEAGLGLTEEDFELRNIVEEMAEATKLLKPADTMGRMKQDVGSAAAEGRDLETGVKKSTLDLARAIEDAAGDGDR